MKRITSVILLSVIISFITYGQDFTMPVLSPNAKIWQQFSTSFISVDYSRPSVRNRIIFGDIVPFDKPWRTGANASTKLTFGEDVNFGGTEVKAGTYSLYTIPNSKEWTVILNKELDITNAANFKTENDVARLKIQSLKSDKKIETLTISIDNITTNSANLNLTWENTSITIPIIADNKAKILAYLEKELNKTNPIYQRAANYYLEENYNLDNALIYINKAIEGNPDAYWLYWTKASIYAKMNNQTEAIKIGEIALEKAKVSGAGDEYQKKLNELKDSFK